MPKQQDNVYASFNGGSEIHLGEDAHVVSSRSFGLAWLATALWIIAGNLGPVLAKEGEVLSPRVANYTIEVRLDPSSKTLDGKEVLTWRNDTRVPAHELLFHLYYNAWKNNKSSWLREEALRSPAQKRKIRKIGRAHV